MKISKERLFLLRNNSRQCEEHVLERGYLESLLGFSCHAPSRQTEANWVESMTIFTQTSTFE